MMRTFGVVILGYVVIALLVLAPLSLVYVLIGADGAFKAGTYDISVLWIVLSFVIGFGAAFGGGYLVARMARSGVEIKALAILVVVLGAVSAISAMTESAGPAVRDSAVGLAEAISNSRQPSWVAILNPLIAVVGVFVGARGAKAGQ